jgi:hypothetical protein
MLFFMESFEKKNLMNVRQVSLPNLPSKKEELRLRIVDPLSLLQRIGVREMECPNGCTKMRVVRTERIFYRGEEPVVIRDLEFFVCPECGCESMPLSTARMVENVLNGKVAPIGKFTAPLYQPAQQA